MVDFFSLAPEQTGKAQAGVVWYLDLGGRQSRATPLLGPVSKGGGPVSKE